MVYWKPAQRMRSCLSEVLDAAEELGDYDGGPFSGYAKIVTDFTLADGVAYISDWAAFTATATLETRRLIAG